jgi:DNA repair protein RadC
MNGIKKLAVETRPRERLKEYGVTALSDDELIAIILRTGTKNTNAKELANLILLKIAGINNFNNTSLTDLASIKGVGEVKAITLLAAIELGKRSLKLSNNHLKINSNRIVYDLFKYDFINVYQEKFIALFLDTKKYLITSEVIFIGTVSSSTIHPREIFKTAMKNSASSIIILHNHPTGDATPSKADQ